jgi:cysteinyl-tRNA synthetase
MVEGQKMSKSLGNFYTLRDLFEKGYQPEVIRYLLVSVPYHKKLNFTFDGLKAAATSIDRLRNYKLRLDTDKFPPGENPKITERTALALKQFEESLDDDLNTAEALAAIFEYVRDTNSNMDAGEFHEDNRAAGLELFQRFDSIMDVLNPTVGKEGITEAQIDAMIAERTQAKKTKNFKRSDEIRAELLEQGVILEDTKEGMRWKRK